MTFEFTKEEVQVLIAGLAELPLKTGFNLVQKLLAAMNETPKEG